MFASPFVDVREPLQLGVFASRANLLRTVRNLMLFKSVSQPELDNGLTGYAQFTGFLIQ